MAILFVEVILNRANGKLLFIQNVNAVISKNNFNHHHHHHHHNCHPQHTATHNKDLNITTPHPTNLNIVQHSQQTST